MLPVLSLVFITCVCFGYMSSFLRTLLIGSQLCSYQRTEGYPEQTNALQFHPHERTNAPWSRPTRKSERMLQDVATVSGGIVVFETHCRADDCSLASSHPYADARG
ncbi:uncharacterized protein IWZ02DRAFT_446704 [Phyllosticta citriasiana]|uniref:uncharacterized protein n=1 Tax=Phyllosticta citriasiana TaxID=595635 RepID=UPI0030FDB342